MSRINDVHVKRSRRRRRCRCRRVWYALTNSVATHSIGAYAPFELIDFSTRLAHDMNRTTRRPHRLSGQIELLVLRLCPQLSRKKLIIILVTVTYSLSICLKPYIVKQNRFDVNMCLKYIVSSPITFLSVIDNVWCRIFSTFQFF